MSGFTHNGGSSLVMGMDKNEEVTEAAYIDYLEARNAALTAAAGQMVVDNIPTVHLRIIANNTTNELISLAARVVLYQRERGVSDG